jgi:hypothetical protein
LHIDRSEGIKIGIDYQIDFLYLRVISTPHSQNLPGMTHKTQINFRQFFIFGFAFCLTFLFINSCKKADILSSTSTAEAKVIQETPQNFFNLPANASPVLKRIAKELERQNKSKEFISAFISKEGFPIWGKSRIERHIKKGKTDNFEGEDGLADTTVYIPLVVSSEHYVTGFLKATIDDTIDIKIYRQNDYVNFPFKTPQSSTSVTTAEEYAIRFMSMDKDVFGTTEFIVNDKRMFNNSTDYSDTANIQRFVSMNSGGGGGDDGFADGSTTNNYQYEVCWTAMTYREVCSVNNCCNWVEWGTYTHCTTYESGGGTGGGGGSGSGGGGGGGGTWPFPPSGPGGGGIGCTEEFGGSITNSIIPIECNPSGGNPWPPLPTVVQTLRPLLGISSVQMDWLTINIAQANRILTYLQDNNGDVVIANAHIILMMEEAEYLAFVNNQAVTGDYSKMWWNDETWLESIEYDFNNEDIFNFFVDATSAGNPKPIEFANICAGMSSMIQASGDKKERGGYITLDGQFIYSPRAGSTGDLPVEIHMKNGQAYYKYKMNLGAPTRTYFGMITNNETQEYWIPVRTVIHSHFPDQVNNGLTITTNNPGKSDDDATMALLIQENIQSVNLYVVEVKDNGKYLVASFSINSTDYTIVGDDLILPNSDVCNLIN